MSIQNISVLGGGAWGTALALTCARAGRSVTLWEHEPGNAEHLETERESKFLPGVRLDDGIKFTRELGGRPAPTRSCWWCRRRPCARSALRWRRF